jgi:hypothetical protein
MLNDNEKIWTGSPNTFIHIIISLFNSHIPSFLQLHISHTIPRPFRQLAFPPAIQ